MDNKTLAIIGCGATAVAFIRSLIEQCILQALTDIHLLIFEPAPLLGVGLAYQEDLNSLLINRPAETMSVCPYQSNEFYHWIKKKIFAR